jgi:hypothetical protein
MPNGNNKIQSYLGMLEALKALGILDYRLIAGLEKVLNDAGATSLLINKR